MLTRGGQAPLPKRQSCWPPPFQRRSGLPVFGLLPQLCPGQGTPGWRGSCLDRAGLAAFPAVALQEPRPPQVRPKPPESASFGVAPSGGGEESSPPKLAFFRKEFGRVPTCGFHKFLFYLALNLKRI